MPGRSELVTAAATAFRARAYAQAAELYRRVLADAGIEVTERADLLVRLARSLDRAGATDEALTVCEEAAASMRRCQTYDDGALLAEAATAIRSVESLDQAGRLHELCVEALAALDPADEVRRRRVEAVLAATESRWARPTSSLGESMTDAETRFRSLQADHAQRLAAEYVHDRLSLADQAIALGRGTGVAEYTAWGLSWRMDALAQLADRVGVEAELAVLDQVTRRLAEPRWTARVLRVRAALAFADGDLEACRTLVDRSATEAPDDEWTRFLRVVWRSFLAEETGAGLGEAEREVRAELVDAPFFARGWLAEVLLAAGRREEVETLWRSLAPHVHEVPPGALESLITHAGHAWLCVALGDTETAEALGLELLPFAELWVTAGAEGPPYGPVRLHLGRLATLRGDFDDAEKWLRAALAAAEGNSTLPLVAECHYALAELAAARLRAEGSAEHRSMLLHEARDASRRATELGLRPLAERIEKLLGASAGPSRRTGGAAGLTLREEDVVGLLAQGLSNRAIAERLFLSERTVENHVRHALQRTGHTSRAGLAGWYAARP